MYQRLKSSRSDPDNLTLCPILDFANHRASNYHVQPRPSDAETWDAAPHRRLGDNLTLIVSPGIYVEAGQELFLQYGAHSNVTLYAEYGFALPITKDLPLEVDLHDIIEGILSKSPVGTETKVILEQERYWGSVRMCKL